MSKNFRYFCKCCWSWSSLAEHCHYLPSPKKAIIKLNCRNYIRPALLNKSELKTLKPESLNLPGETKVFINESLWLYYKKLWPKCKMLWGSGHIIAFWASIGSLRIKLSMILCPWLRTIVIWKSCSSAIHWLKITSYWLILIFFAVLTIVHAYYWIYHSKLVVFCHLENPRPSLFTPFLQILPMSL